MFAALNGAHNQTLVSAALERFDCRNSRGLVMRAKVARIPHVICHEVPPTDFESHEMREMCR